MLRRKSSQWTIYPHKIRYTQYSEDLERWALPSREWWTDFADKWEHTEIIEFIEVEVTEAMQKRFEEIRNMPEDFGSIYTEYVLTGNFPAEDEMPSDHPFRMIELRKENAELNTLLNTILGAEA